MSRSAASGWIGRLFLKRSRCVCWGMGSKDQHSKVLCKESANLDSNAGREGCIRRCGFCRHC